MRKKIFWGIIMMLLCASAIFAAYEEPELEITSQPDYIVVGQTAEIKFEIIHPIDGVLYTGSFKIKGTKAGTQTFSGKTVTIKYHLYFPNSGWHWKSATFTPEVTLDVVGMQAINGKDVIVQSFDYEYIAVTQPTGYEDNTIWGGAVSGSGKTITVNFSSVGEKIITARVFSSPEVEKTITVKSFIFDFTIASPKEGLYEQSITFQFKPSSKNENVSYSDYNWSLDGASSFGGTSSPAAWGKWTTPPSPASGAGGIGSAKGSLQAANNNMKSTLNTFKNKLDDCVPPMWFPSKKLWKAKYLKDNLEPLQNQMLNDFTAIKEALSNLLDLLKRKKDYKISLTVKGTSTIDASKSKTKTKYTSLPIEKKLDSKLQTILDKISSIKNKIAQLLNEINNLANPWTSAVSNIDTIIGKLESIYNNGMESMNLIDELCNNV